MAAIWTPSSSGYYTNASTTATWELDNTWRTWTESTTSDSIWKTWVEDSYLNYAREIDRAIRTSYREAEANWRVWAQQTEEQRLAEQAAEAARALERRSRSQAATRRAEELLKAQLSPEQLASWTERRIITVLGQDGKLYEIDCKRQHQNIYELGLDGKRVREYCIYASGGCPLPDNHLAQMLMLRFDIERFKQVANSWALAA